MNSITLLENILTNIHNTLHSVVDDLTEQEWKARSAPDQNMIGFTVWHLPRIQDNIIQTWIRGIPEVVDDERWADWHQFKPLGSGVGITSEEADVIAFSVQKVDVLVYADAVQQEILTWLLELSDDDLDRIPNSKENLSSHPEYQTPGYHKEADGLLGQPVWVMLMLPCMTHIHQHLGEIMLAKEILRGNLKNSKK